MRDEQIIKALRCCADKGCSFCSEKGKAYCKETVASLAWDLIQRQNAEIESLKDSIKELRLEMSYMIKPNAFFGDRHEMGNW